MTSFLGCQASMQSLILFDEEDEVGLRSRPNEAVVFKI